MKAGRATEIGDCAVVVERRERERRPTMVRSRVDRTGLYIKLMREVGGKRERTCVCDERMCGRVTDVYV